MNSTKAPRGINLESYRETEDVRNERKAKNGKCQRENHPVLVCSVELFIEEAKLIFIV